MRPMGSHDDTVRVTPSLGSRAAVWLATGLGIGLVTPAPGTIAGLWGVPLAAAVAMLPPWGPQILLIGLLALAAVPICHAAADALGATHDPGAIVLDEIVALPIAFVGLQGVTWPL